MYAKVYAQLSERRSDHYSFLYIRQPSNMHLLFTHNMITLDALFIRMYIYIYIHYIYHTISEQIQAARARHICFYLSMCRLM